jgi:hypothetical protein
MKTDELEEFQQVQYRIRSEGLHYCFAHYSEFGEIIDPEFHRLRTAYLEAAGELEAYVDKKIEDLLNR